MILSGMADNMNLIQCIKQHCNIVSKKCYFKVHVSLIWNKNKIPRTKLTEIVQIYIIHVLSTLKRLLSLNIYWKYKLDRWSLILVLYNLHYKKNFLYSIDSHTNFNLDNYRLQHLHVILSVHLKCKNFADDRNMKYLVTWT